MISIMPGTTPGISLRRSTTKRVCIHLWDKVTLAIQEEGNFNLSIGSFSYYVDVIFS